MPVGDDLRADLSRRRGGALGEVLDPSSLDRALLLLESERDLFRYPCSACPTDMAEEEEVESMPVTEPAWSVMEDSATDPESLRCRDLLLEA